MKKWLDKEDWLGLFAIIVLLTLFCSWIIIFIVMPIIGIGETIKSTFQLKYEGEFIITGNLGALGGIVVASGILYEKLILKLEKKLSRKKLKNIKAILLSLVLTIVLAVIVLLVIQTNMMLFLSQSVIYLFGIEIVLFALCLMLFTNSYTNNKIKNAE